MQAPEAEKAGVHAYISTREHNGRGSQLQEYDFLRRLDEECDLGASDRARFAGNFFVVALSILGFGPRSGLPVWG